MQSLSERRTDFCQVGVDVITTQINTLQSLTARIDEKFACACKMLLSCRGHIIVTGMGKSGHIGKKIASTLSSTGSPSFFIHPAEACHGDMGALTKNDILIAVSNSGETEEIIRMILLIKKLNIPLISITGNPRSSIAVAAEINIDVSVDKEACPLGLAPTCSTTATMVMGDAIAMATAKARNFSRHDFALLHPGGSLGKLLIANNG